MAAPPHLQLVPTPAREALSDDDLMLAVRAGSQPAFEQLVRRHHRLVKGLATRMLNDAALGHDVAQDVFLSVWSERARYQPRGKLPGYLAAMTRHRCSMVRRRGDLEARHREAEGPVTDDAGEPLPLERLVERERAKEVRAQLQHVPEKAREVLVLRFGLGHSLEEISQLTEQPLGTVKSHVFRGLQRLRTLLGGQR